MKTDPRTILLMNYYRDAELRGANLLLRLMSHLDDADSQTKLALHLADETRHAWLWTKRITELGGDPAPVADGYQRRIGARIVPRTLLDILALTVVVEERSHQRYSEHAERPDLDPKTRAILREVTQDEKWHIAWIRGKLEEVAAANGGLERMHDALARYREIDRQVYAELRAKEQSTFAEGTCDGSTAQA